MSSDGVQITIPDFDDDSNFAPTPVFGRSGGGFWGSTTSGQTSPVVSTPVADRGDRSYFHSRGDSVTSDDSSHSIQIAARKFKAPFVHSSHSSLATTNSTSSPFSKKGSFASLRNAFKSTKSSDPAPPLPTFDHQAYPVLKNPFNRSTSSLAQHVHGRPSIHASPTQFRPSTPASGDSRIRGQSRSRGHAYAKSQHSHSGSIFHSSDPGSDLGHAAVFVPSLSPPPVPPVPSGFAGYAAEDEEQDDDNIVVEARTPSDFALHAIFIRFAASAEALIEEFVSQPMDRDPYLPTYMGPSVDDTFDDLLRSLGKIAQKHGKPVVDSVMRWRKSQTDHDGAGDFHPLYPGWAKARTAHAYDTEVVYTERRSLASIYIMCRALVAITQALSKDSLSDAEGNDLEELIFEQFRKPDLKLLTSSANHRVNAELYAVLLGNLANIRFESVTDRYLVELGPVAAGQVPKDADYKYEHLVKGLRHVQIRVWPPESFEEGAEFLDSLSKSFENAHGFRLKTVFAETLAHLLYDIGKTAQAEVNHPQWAKAIELIYSKARDMSNKPRYWQVAFPLAVVSLCVAPREYFMRNWMSLVESGISKLKDKPFRIIVLNGVLRLVWTYLYRCQESASTVATKIEALMKHFFPANRLTVFPQEDRIEIFAYIVHYILSRHFDFGSEFCLELLQERSINGQASNVIGHLAPDRMSIAVQAILLSVRLLEREEQGPVWPSSADFTVVPTWDDYPSSSEFLPATSPIFQGKAGWIDFMERCNTCIKAIATACYQTVGRMSILDDQWSVLRLPSYEEAHNYLTRHHPEGVIAYPTHLFAPISVLQMCYQSWPRCLHPSMKLDSVFDMLIRGVLHVEPGITEVASAALLRFTPDFTHSCILLSRFHFHLFDPQCILGEGAGLRLVAESHGLLHLWHGVVEKWTLSITQRPRETLTEEEEETITSILDSLEAGVLFLLCHMRRTVHGTAVKIVRLLGVLLTHLRHEPSSPAEEQSGSTVRITDFLLNSMSTRADLDISADSLNEDELNRLDQWRSSDRPDATLRLIESDKAADREIWRHILAAFLQAFMEKSSPVVSDFREKLVAALRRYHPFVLQLSAIGTRTHPGVPTRGLSIGEKDGSKLVAEHSSSVQQWQHWGMLLCATAHVSETRPTMNSSARDHSRARSEINVEREQMETTRDMFKYFSPFMDSDYSAFRDAAVFCISSLPPYGYSYLLEDLSILSSRQLYDDPRGKAATVPLIGRARRQERFHTAVARIYYYTAHYLRSQRSSAKQTALAHVLKYIRNMQAFLCSPENRNQFTLQRLRRYFCGTVERFFGGLASLNDSDRFIPSGMHLALYRLCEEWCQVGKQPESVTKRLIDMQTAAANSYQDRAAQAELIQRFQTETRELSNAAVGSMSSLIAKAYFPPEISASGSPSDRPSPDQVRPLEASQILDRLLAIMANFNERVQDCGKKALRSLLLHVPYDNLFSDHVLRRAFVTTRGLETSNARFFEVVADIVCTTEHGFRFSQVVCLGLSNLWHPVLEIRRQAFNMLETIHEQSSGIIPIGEHEAAVGSSAPSVYLHAHRVISATLAGEHPDYAIEVLAQFADWIPRVFDSNPDAGHGNPNSVSGGLLVLLQSLEHWVPSIDLMSNDRSGLTREGRSAIYHLMALTTRYAETHAEQIFVLWTKLVDAPYQSNGHAVIRFLLEQSHKVGSATFIGCAAKVVACLSQSEIGKQLFQELCSIIEPARMLPTLEHKLAMPDAEEVELWSDLDVLFSQEPRLSLGAAQFSLLFLSECALQYALEDFRDLDEQLHVLLHALFTHLDHRSPFVQQRCRHMLFQLLRSCMSGYDKLPDRSLYPTRATLKEALLDVERDCKTHLWKEEDSGAEVELKMRVFCSRIISLLEPLSPSLTTKLGSLSLKWSTACAIRPIAFRSLQLFRAIEPKFGQGEIANLIGRLSESISGEQQSLQDFAVELITTMTTMASSGELDLSLLPQMFWCTVACLSTTVEAEFRRVLDCLEALLIRLDLDDPHTAELLISHKPSDWRGNPSVQAALLTGLRSSKTSPATFKILQHLAKVADSSVIDDSGGRVRDLYTLSLPWCLHAMTVESNDESLAEFALNIGHLADLEERPSITRIMTSFAKARFRTKEDFLRQSVASLREHYGKDHWAEVVTLLVGLVLNNDKWLRVHTLHILKVLFQQRETKNSVDVLGSEVLMPLLRLLETDLASEALDVLDEPLQISGGPAAKHVIRMSLHNHLVTSAQEVESVAELFGIPQDSGWCVPRSSARRDVCRANVQAVFDLCKAPWRPSRLDFQPDDLPLLEEEIVGDDVGDLVQNLHELSSYFQEERQPHLIPNRHLEARVAAILAKSTDPATDTPQTPFVDIFDIETVGSYEFSDELSSASDTESDLFEFDSFTRS